MHDIMELVWMVPRYVLKTHPGGARAQQASVVGLDTENFDEVQEKSRMPNGWCQLKMTTSRSAANGWRRNCARAA